MDPRFNDPTIRQHAAESDRPTDAHSATRAAEGFVDDARAKTEAVADDLRREARDVAKQGVEKIDQAMTQTGAQIATLAQTMRERRPEGQIGEMTTATADVLERSGRYLQEHDLDDVRSDVERVIRRYPLQSVLITAGLGFLFARSMKGSRHV